MVPFIRFNFYHDILIADILLIVLLSDPFNICPSLNMTDQVYLTTYFEFENHLQGFLVGKLKKKLYDIFKFSRRWVLRLLFSDTWRHVVWYVDNSVSEEGSFSMFRMIKSAGLSKMLVPIYQTTLHCIPEDRNISKTHYVHISDSEIVKTDGL
jgi:hypothetical protein